MRWARYRDLWFDISYHISRSETLAPYLFWVIVILLILFFYWQCGVPAATPSETPREWVPP